MVDWLLNSMLEVWLVCNCLVSKFYDEVSAILYLFGCLLRIRGCFPSLPILLSIKMPKYGKKKISCQVAQ
jgi:hypothetical protein